MRYLCHTLLLFLFLVIRAGGMAVAQTQDVKLNKEAIKRIDFQFGKIGTTTLPTATPKAESTPRTWLEFKEDRSIPLNWTDTVKWKRNDTFSITPYSIWTQSGKDPVSEMYYATHPEEQKGWELYNALENGLYKAVDKSYYLIPTGNLTFYFDADKILFELLTKRGRSIKHNRKYAVAWKNYANYIPTIADAQKFPNFGRRMNAQDSAIVIAAKEAAKRDSIALPTIIEKRKKIPQDERAIVGDGSVSDWYKEIERAKEQDSIRRKEALRKKKSQTNVYEYERAVKKIKEGK